MRYSRLRTVIQGPTKRAPRATTIPATLGGRITKPRKTARPPVAAINTSTTSVPTMLQAASTPTDSIVHVQSPFVQHFKPDPDTAPPPLTMPDYQNSHRFMTPCSDEMLPQTPHLDYSSCLQTPDVSRPMSGVSGSAFGGFDAQINELDECGHPEEFKHSHDALLSHHHHDHQVCNNNGALYLPGQMSWYMATNPLQDAFAASASTSASTSGLVEERCYHSPTEQAQAQAQLGNFAGRTGSVMIPEDVYCSMLSVKRESPA